MEMARYMLICAVAGSNRGEEFVKVKEITEEIRTMGRSGSWYEALVTTDARVESIVSANQALPGLKSILVIVAPHAIKPNIPSMGPKISFAEAGGESIGYSAAAYISVMRFLLEKRHRLDKTLFFLPDADVAVVRAMQDLQWFQSGIIIKLLTQTQGGGDLFFKWAELLLESNQPMQALQFVNLLESKMSRDELAKLALPSLLDMDCADQFTLGWLDSMPAEKTVRKTTRKKIQQAMVHKRARAKQVLDRNMEIIRARWPNGAKLVDEASTQGICVGSLPEVPWLYDLKTGIVERENYPVFFQRRSGAISVINPPHDPRLLVPPDKFEFYTRQIPGIIIGSFMALDAIVNLTANRLVSQMVNILQPIYLVEKDPVMARLVLENVDLSSVLEEKRVECFIGPDAMHEMKNLFEQNSRLLLPAMRISTDHEMGSILDEVIEKRNNSIKTHTSAWASLYPPDFARQAYEAFNKNNQQRPRILLVTSLFSTVVQYIIRDLAQAFSKLGADVHILKEKSGIERCDTRVVAEGVYNYHPHLLVIIDHLRPEYQGLLPANLPWVSWNQDPLPNLFDTNNISGLGGYDFSYTVSSVWLEQFRSLGYSHMELLPFAANTDIYHPLEEPMELCDEVVFVSNMETSKDYFPEFPGLQKKLQAAFDEDDITYGDSASMSKLILNALGSHPGERKLASLVDVATWRFERWYDRRRVLRWLVDSGFPVGLYGRGWDSDPEFKTMARGWVAQGHDLAKLYRTSKAVIHVNSMVNTHQRVFECLASGGLVLARRTPYDDLPGELSSCLTPGKEIELFGNARELAEILSRVFDDEEWRQGLISAGQKRVMNEHTYLARARTILKDVKNILGQYKARAA